MGRAQVSSGDRWNFGRDPQPRLGRLHGEALNETRARPEGPTSANNAAWIPVPKTTEPPLAGQRIT